MPVGAGVRGRVLDTLVGTVKRVVVSTVVPAVVPAGLVVACATAWPANTNTILRPNRADATAGLRIRLRTKRLRGIGVAVQQSFPHKQNGSGTNDRCPAGS